MKKSGRQESSGNMNDEDKMKNKINTAIGKHEKLFLFGHFISFYSVLSQLPKSQSHMLFFFLFIILVLSESDMASYIKFSHLIIECVS